MQVFDKKEKTSTFTSRRQFLKTTSMALAGVSIVPRSLFIGPSSAAPKIALQLYTVRDQIKKDIAGTLKRIASIGFEGVETAFWPDGISISEAGKHLKDAGLSVCSAHIELPLGDKKAAMLETATTFDCKKMIWHGWPEDKRYSSIEGTKELANIYNECFHIARENGLQFGLHNHWWEYRNKIDGRHPFQVLLEYVDPGIFFELDTYWIKVAGFDPASIVSQFGKRAPLLHIKDGPAKWNDNLPKDNPDPMTPVGKGTQNFPSIVKAANGNTEWMIVEMDKTAIDVFEAIQQSYDYLVRNKLATGRNPVKS